MNRKWLVVSVSVVLMVLGTSVFTAQASPGDSNLWQLLKAAYQDLQGQIDDLHHQIDKMAEKPTYWVDLEVAVEPGDNITMWARCDIGDKVTGGGFYKDFETTVSSSRPSRLASGQEEWEIWARIGGTKAVSLTAYAVCLDLPPLRNHD